MAIGIFNIPVFDVGECSEDALEGNTGKVNDEVGIIKRIASERLGRDVVDRITVGEERLFGELRDVAEGIEAGARGIEDVGGVMAGDSFGHGAAASIAKADEEDTTFFNGGHEDILPQAGGRLFCARGFPPWSMIGDESEKMPVNGGVGSEFRVKRGGKDVTVLDKRGLAMPFGEDGDSLPDLFDDGAANEDHFERVFLQGAGTEEHVAGELAAVAVAQNGHVHELERVLWGIFHVRGEKNGAGTGAEDGVAVRGEVAYGVVETFFLEELELRGAFTAGENEAVAGVEVGDSTDFHRVLAELVEHGGVGLEVTLDGENADFHDDVTKQSAQSLLS